ncbi:ABC transporter permease [Alkalilimnicola ehrlichii]|uniref:ABC transporter permease n=1 Tax=Alkalilimnicola ehrlichii TaxID=351052 RepID=A0A3E0WR29_9GAMM|nr:ABC transporter permease subunit [Alkalilimnicola ehrlichii]RFA27964.1 ABC transporter permease [Alkalilimnicola ehrlichii]RFA34611.1 ABC transporter permease [Alkalilimnicola ehrlichii]
MSNRLGRRLRGGATATLSYLWSGWGAIASLLMFLAVWDLGNRIWGDLALPSPGATFQALWALGLDGSLGEAVAVTAYRAISGFGIALALGSTLGILAGLSLTASVIARPLVTVLMGIPPISWVVLAMIWFGATDASPIFTVVIASLPLIFVGALQGSRTLDGQLKEMALAFRLSPWQRFRVVYLPHILSYLFPAWISALGMSWKVVVMAELLATPDGVGAGLAVARSHLDTAAAMAWIVSIVGLLLVTEYLLLEPLKRRLEMWRDNESK